MRGKPLSSLVRRDALDELSPSEELEVKLMAIAYDRVDNVSKLTSKEEVIKGR